MKIRVAACQHPVHEELSGETIESILKQKPDFVCLPEHYPLPETVQTVTEAAALFSKRKSYLSGLSSRLNTVLVGGTLTEETPDGYYNTCFLFERGKEVGYYRKVHPTSSEEKAGIRRGQEFKMFEVRNLKVGVLICADVLNEQSFQEMSSRQSQIVFVPTASPFRAGESVDEKYRRDETIFQAGARIMGCPVVKTCGVGTVFGHLLQGRSLITTPQRIVARAGPQEENRQLLLVADLEIQNRET